MLIGYARVSTDNQDTAAQVKALKAAGCERIYREKASGGRWDRPELNRLLDQLRQRQSFRHGHPNLKIVPSLSWPVPFRLWLWTVASNQLTA